MSYIGAAKVDPAAALKAQQKEAAKTQNKVKAQDVAHETAHLQTEAIVELKKVGDAAAKNSGIIGLVLIGLAGAIWFMKRK